MLQSKCIRLLIIQLIVGLSSPGQIIPTSVTMTPGSTLHNPDYPGVYDQNILLNFIRVWDAKAQVSDTLSSSLNDVTKYKQTTQYFDGLGRPVQTVIMGANYDGTKDMVSTNRYDSFGREALKYLPYSVQSGSNGKFRLYAFSELSSYYTNRYNNDIFPYSKTDFEIGSPGRPIKEYAPGNSWVGMDRGGVHKYYNNTTADSVRMWIVADTSVTTSAIYPSGSLTKSITINEDGKQVIEFKNLSDKVILKKVQLTAAADNGSGSNEAGWVCTYYVYDDFDRLRFVIQPTAVVSLLNNGSWIITSALSNELCFKYSYDTRGRMIRKKVPGAATVLMAYDRRDRLVFSQDGNQRASGNWLTTFYDELNRPVSTALYSSSQTQDQLQSYLNGITTANPVAVLTEGNLTRLTYNYYDGYTMSGYQAYNASNISTAASNVSLGDEASEVLAKTDLTRGMVTSSSSRVLETSSFLNSTTYYDMKKRPVQSLVTNNNGGVDATSMVYSYTGKILSALLIHNNPTASLSGTATTQVLTRNEYHNDYLYKVDKKVNSNTWQPVSLLEYDDLGKIIKKTMGKATSNFVINNEYNLRGWLTGINKSDQNTLQSQGGTSFYQAIFSESLSYDFGFSKVQYTGNIAGIKWAQAGDKQIRSYGFDYDPVNRLTIADFTQQDGSSWTTNAGIDYSVRNLTYDANGNIQTMSQKGLKLFSSPVIDSLSYTYQTSSNKLAKVTDAVSDATTQLGDFKDGTNGSMDDYNYDFNGNLVADSNKHISSITYNFLNLPKIITVDGKGTIQYTYDAVGNKIQKRTTEGTRVTRTDYISGFVYQNDTLQFMGHEEGRARYAKQYFLAGDSAYWWQWDFFYKDHLGNIRTVVTEETDTAKYFASFETAQRTKETALFSNIAESAYPTASVTNYPTDATTSPNDYTSRLNGGDRKVGAAITLKVMAGDKIDLGVKYWYPWKNNVVSYTPISSQDIFATLFGTLSAGAAAFSGGKFSAADLSRSGSPVIPGLQNFLDSHPPGDTTTYDRPHSYLNWVLLDEQFHYVPGGSGFLSVEGYHTDLQTLANSGISIPKNGYLFVYVSNETVGWNVFFDNLVVQHYKGPLTEENSYYPGGLTMVGISSKAAGGLENKKKYNGIEFDTDLDLNLYEAFYRDLDPQTGRFLQIDPKTEGQETESPYSSMAS